MRPPDTTGSTLTIFSHDAAPIEGVKNLGFSVDCGPALFDSIASDLASISVEIPSASAKRLYNALQKGFQGCGPGFELEYLNVFQALSPYNEIAAPRELVANRVVLDRTTGKCPRTGVHLRLINLNAEQKQQLKSGLHYLAKNAYGERGKKESFRAEQQLLQFGSWLK
jgi:hypothetical protein